MTRVNQNYSRRAQSVARYLSSVGFLGVEVPSPATVEISGVLRAHAVGSSYWKYGQMLDTVARPGWIPLVIHTTKPTVEDALLIGRLGDLAPLLERAVLARLGEND